MPDVLVLLKDTLNGLERVQTALKDIMIHQQISSDPNVTQDTISENVGSVVR